MDRKEEKKNSESASFFKELGSFIAPYKGKYIISVLLSIFAVFLGLLSYGFIGILTGKIFAGNDTADELILLALVIGACKVGSAILLNISTLISHKAAYYTLADIRGALSDKLVRLPMGYFEKNGSGRLKTMLVDRVEEIEKTLAHLLPEMTANLLIPAGMIAWMFFIDWRLSLCVLLWIVIGMVLSFGMMIGYEKKYEGQVAANKAMNQAVVEYVGGIEVIKTFNQADACYKKYGDAVSHHAEYSAEWTRSTQIFSSLCYSVAPVSIFPVLLLGMKYYSEGSLEASTLFLFMILSLGIFGPIIKASSYFDQLAQMGTIAKEIKEVLDYPELKRSEKKQVETKESLLIEIKYVEFSYEKEGKNAIDGVSISIPEKTMLALVGPSGSGKSTIAKLLAGYWDVTKGSICIGGNCLSDYSQEQLNQLIAYVDQDTFLFDTTIMNNIRMGRPDATDEQVIEAAKRAGCDQFIKELPEGYNTQAGAAGGRLSGGERQRIAIARAMMKDAPIMILDEATASSDPENEAAIQEALSVAAKDKTLIVVAHRLATIVGAEQIAYVEDGKIIASGTHKELLEKCLQYRKLWELSMEGSR